MAVSRRDLSYEEFFRLFLLYLSWHRDARKSRTQYGNRKLPFFLGVLRTLGLLQYEDSVVLLRPDGPLLALFARHWGAVAGRRGQVPRYDPEGVHCYLSYVSIDGTDRATVARKISLNLTAVGYTFVAQERLEAYFKRRFGITKARCAAAERSYARPKRTGAERGRYARLTRSASFSEQVALEHTRRRRGFGVARVRARLLGQMRDEDGIPDEDEE